jgi:hypothetical protein
LAKEIRPRGVCLVKAPRARAFFNRSTEGIMESRPTTESLFRRSLSVFGSGFVTFLALALVVQLPSLVFNLIVSNLQRSPGGPSAEPIALTCAASIVFLPIMLVFTTLASAVVVYGVFQVLRGAPLRIGDCVLVVAGQWQPVLGLAILVGLSVFGGLLCLVIPGIVISCGLFVAVPALIVERIRIIEAMKRSWKLTSGYKGIIFFFSLGVGVFQFGASWGSTALIAASPLSGLAAGAVLTAVVDYGILAVATSFQAVATGVAYHDLRAFSEGLGEDELAAVFD